MLLAFVTSAGAMAAFSARTLSWVSTVKGVLFLVPGVLMLFVDLLSFRTRIGDAALGDDVIWFPAFGPLTLATFLVSLLLGARAGLRAADEYRM